MDYEPGMHREVDDSLVESYLRPTGIINMYVVFEEPKPVKAAPVFQPELEQILAAKRAKPEPAPWVEPQTSLDPEVEDKPKKKK